MVGQLETGAVLEPAVKYHRIIDRFGLPRDNHQTKASFQRAKVRPVVGKSLLVGCLPTRASVALPCGLGVNCHMLSETSGAGKS